MGKSFASLHGFANSLHGFSNSFITMRFPHPPPPKQATEDFMVHLFEDCNLCAIHAKRVTISEYGVISSIQRVLGLLYKFHPFVTAH